MAKGGTVIEEVVPTVDLSPEATEVRKNLAMAGISLLDKGRLQAVVNDWRERHPFVEGVLDNGGNRIPIPEIVVTEDFIQVFEKQLVPIIQDCCEDTNSVIAAKVRAQRMSNTDGRVVLKGLDTALCPLRGTLTIPPTPVR